MRKWMIIGCVMFLFPWITSLVWMQAAGAEQEQLAGEPGESGEAQEQLAGEPGESGEAQEPGKAGKSGEKTGAWDQTGAAGQTGETGQIGAAGQTGETETEVVVGQSPGTTASAARRILVERKGIRTYMSLEDYLPGVMVCQIDPDYHMEALKCQAVIARTYICRLMEGRSEIHEEELDLDYIGAEDTKILQNRDRTIAGLERCRQAVEETKGIVMEYEGRCILPLFHRMSAGRTRKGETDFPYLQAVESRWDTKREDFLTETDWSLEEFADRINQIPDAATVTASRLPEQIQVVKKDDSGYVLQIKIGARTYSGEDIQYALGLPSACYTVEPRQESLISGGTRTELRVTVRGSGHGYGLSQTGADSMAEEGWLCENILSYYYAGVVFKNFS